ncbi:MFS transporter [Komagataeibacter xylinus]|uniref:MFS transporter n=1 Tax=Komagataeibacter xylinus TaxID=28448 RepID=A0A857FNY7_KOMXY|nr:MFS transporter [Komagataeibacter xylinus]QHC36003.1 MFS transporter [Komagataeibacter xylinus]
MASGSRWGIVLLFMAAYVLSFIDRQILALLIGPIRADLGITDTQFGLLSGLAFSIFYAVLGLPIAGLSDRYARPVIIAAGILVWSIATLGCAFVHSFAMLFVFRIMVGAGEATLAPAVYSYIADIIPRPKLGWAMSVFSLGSFIGSGLAFMLGGSILSLTVGQPDLNVFGAVIHPWQLCFAIVGLPGIVLSAIIFLWVREPVQAGGRALTRKGASMSVAMQYLWQNRALFVPHILGYTFIAMTLFSLLGWMPAVLMRVHGMSPRIVGFAFGGIAMVCGVSGVLTSGRLVDTLTQRGHKGAPMITGAIGALGVVLPMAIIGFAQATPVILICLAVAFYFASFPMPPSTFVQQVAVPQEMRARLSAVLLFFNAMGGLAGGAFLIGFLNDHVFHSPMAVGTSLCLVAIGSSSLGALLLLASRKPFERLMAQSRHRT